MKLLYLLLLILCVGCGRRDMEVQNVQTSLYEDRYTQNLTVVLNTSGSSDYEACAREIIARCKDNRFPNVLFSYDQLGYPSSVNVSVYAKEAHIKNGALLFFFHYERNDSGEELYTIRLPESAI